MMFPSNGAASDFWMCPLTFTLRGERLHTFSWTKTRMVENILKTYIFLFVSFIKLFICNLIKFEKIFSYLICWLCILNKTNRFVDTFTLKAHSVLILIYFEIHLLLQMLISNILKNFVGGRTACGPAGWEAGASWSKTRVFLVFFPSPPAVSFITLIIFKPVRRTFSQVNEPLRLCLYSDVCIFRCLDPRKVPVLLSNFKGITQCVSSLHPFTRSSLLVLLFPSVAS